MDVVKRTIESLRGTIEVASEPGEGSTIALRIPLTLAIIIVLLYFNFRNILQHCRSHYFSHFGTQTY